MDQSKKKRIMQDMVSTATQPLPSLNQVQEQAGTMVNDAKKAVLQKLMGGPQQPTSYQRTPQENEMLAIKGINTMAASKQQEANNTIGRLQGEIGDLESMAQFGDPDAEKQIQLKKELLRRYLMNNK